MKKLLGLLFLIPATGAFAQKLDTLSIEKIMRDPKWIGVSPSNINWANDSKKIYFKWDDDASGDTRLYSVSPGDNKVQKVSIAEQRDLAAGYGEWNKKHSQKIFSKNGDLFLYDVKANKTTRLTNTVAQEDSPVFSGDETKIIYKEDNNLFALNLNGGTLVQLTNFVRTASDKKVRINPANRNNGSKNNSLSCLISSKRKQRTIKKIQQKQHCLNPTS
ncbi:DPP IV N-terminal domain-containing protein [Mucilaginibacter sp. P25]|uniref:DPP IV N-terminal domain-containing protein n=1 Tax=Mucilaginibacter sp. P25 TaxID=3423945 RepID=UPI003D78ED1D